MKTKAARHRAYACAAVAAAAINLAATAEDGQIRLQTGVEISPEAVYLVKSTVKNAWRAENRGEFRHGNAPVRLHLKNPTRLAQPVTLEIPISSRYGAMKRDLTTLHAYTEIPPESERDWDVPVPFVKAVSLADYGSEAWVVRDGAGRAAKLKYWQGENTFLSYAFSRNSQDTLRPWDYMHFIATSHSFDTEALQKSCNEAYIVQQAVAMASTRRNATSRHKSSCWNDDIYSCRQPDFSRFRRWQDLSVYDAIIIAEKDWATMPESFKVLLPDWVAAGGALIWLGEDIDASGISEGPWGLGTAAKWDGADYPMLTRLTSDAAQTFAHTWPKQCLECDMLANKTVSVRRSETPFMLIILVLGAFTILAGPITVRSLARHNHRIALIWVFPSIAVIFSVAVAAVIVAVKGIDPQLEQFAYTIIDEGAGRAVTVCNDVMTAPFTTLGTIKHDARSSIVSYFSGDRNRAGDHVVYTGEDFLFSGGWTPSLWPVSFRTVTVRTIKEAEDAIASGGAEALAPLPYDGKLRKRTVNSEVERRGAK